MTVLGALLVLVVGALVVTRRTAWMPYVLGVTAGLPYSAGIVLAGNSVPLFSLAGLLAMPLLLRRPTAPRPHWVSLAMAGLVVWSILLTAIGPWVFRGVRVLSSRGGVDDQVIDPDVLTWTTSSLAQVVYLVVSVAVVAYLVRLRVTRAVVGVAFAVGTVVSAVRGLSVALGSDFLAPLFDTSTGVIYSYASLRLRGVFNEPSELAAFSLPAAVFFAVVAGSDRIASRPARIGTWALALLACSNLLQASSGVAVVGSAVVVTVGLLVLVVRSLIRGGVGVQWFVLGGLVAAFVLVGWGRELLAPVNALVADKVGSVSWESRTGADLFSLRLVAETAGLGVGLGGNRPSSFVTALFSTIGVPGVVLFAAVVAAALGAVRVDRRLVPVAAALVALLVAKSVGNPDLTTPVLWMLLGVAIVPLRHATDVRPGATSLPVPAPTPTPTPIVLTASAATTEETR